MNAQDLLRMFKIEFEKNIQVILEVKERIVGSSNDEELILAIQTYVLMIQRICDGAAALGLNGIYLYLQCVCLNVYEAKNLSSSEQELIADLYSFWMEPLVSYMDAALTGDTLAIESSVVGIKESLAPPNIIIDPSEEAIIEMTSGLLKVIDVDPNVQSLLDEVQEERESVFLIDEAALNLNWSTIDKRAIEGLLFECQGNLLTVENGLEKCGTSCLNAILAKQTEPPKELSDAINEAKRAAHTIKGSAQMGGIGRLSVFMHKIEDLFDFASSPNVDWRIFARKGLMSWAKLVIEEASKLVETMMDAGLEPAASVGKTRLENFLLCLHSAMEGTPEPQGLLDAQNPLLCGEILLGADLNPRNDAPKESPNAKEASSEMLSALFEGISNSRIRVNHIKAQNASLLNTLRAAKHENIELNKKLDELARFVSEHLLDAGGIDSLEKRNYSEVYTMCVSIGETNSNMKMLLEEVDTSSASMKQQIESVEKNEKNLSHQVLKAQMVEFGSIAGRLKRIVSGAAETCSKEVNYSMLGASTLIEKRMLDNLKDPLMHLLRNSVDHGLEGRDAGTVTLTAESFGNKVRVAIADDGVGINVEGVKKKAIEKGVITSEAAQGMPVDKLRELIFESGFSTKDNVSELSGRGVGLDVVKRSVEGWGGSVSIKDNPSGGTIFELLLPSNMSSVNCLVVKHADGYFAIPTSFISKILEPSAFVKASISNGKAVAVDRTEGRAHIEWTKDGSKTLSPSMDFKTFAKISGLSRSSKSGQRAHDAASKPKALVLHFAGTEIGVLVDETLFIEDMIVRKANALGASKKFVMGTTILLNGDVVPILNAGELIGAASTEGDPTTYYAPEKSESHQKILIVDDSLFMRDFLEKEVQSFGYETIMAINGLDAIRKLGDPGVKMVLTDLEMPEMDGINLTKYIRSQNHLRNLPVFMISSRSTERYKNLADAAGVDSFISKPFDSKKLEAEIAAKLAKG